MAYMHAVAGKAGVNLKLGGIFDYGFDGMLRAVGIRGGKRHVETGFPVDFQLKCTTKWAIDGTDIVYALKTKNYNDLVTRDPRGVGAILILMCLPEEQGEWTQFSEDFMTLKHCCYYTKLVGDPVENENSTKIIRIPRANILTDTCLKQILADERVRKIGTEDNG